MVPLVRISIGPNIHWSEYPLEISISPNIH
jgi:hypothetical protein